MRYQLRYRESIITLVCDGGLLEPAYDTLFEARESIERKIETDPFFGITYDPYPPSDSDVPLIRRMCEASVLSGVGPMAGVAGAVAVSIAERLMGLGSSKVIVENGGDIAIYSPEPSAIGIFADHPTFRNMAFMVSCDHITGICSSSRTVGPSVSLGNSSISTVFSDDVILADCCATALGNLVTDTDALGPAVERISSVDNVSGCMACCGGSVAMLGEIPEMVPADCSRALDH